MKLSDLKRVKGEECVQCGSKNHVYECPICGDPNCSTACLETDGCVVCGQIVCTNCREICPKCDGPICDDCNGSYDGETHIKTCGRGEFRPGEEWPETLDYPCGCIFQKEPIKGMPGYYTYTIETFCSEHDPSLWDNYDDD